MGRIVANVRILNLLDPGKTVQCDALVDTGSAYLVLPRAWQDRLGKLNVVREIDCETATQDLVKVPVCGPVEIRVEGFDRVYGEVLSGIIHEVAHASMEIGGFLRLNRRFWPCRRLHLLGEAELSWQNANRCEKTG